MYTDCKSIGKFIKKNKKNTVTKDKCREVVEFLPLEEESVHLLEALSIEM
jgi:hypothetical protein